MDKETKPRYRCHTGHVYAEGTLAEKKNEALEESLWFLYGCWQYAGSRCFHRQHAPNRKMNILNSNIHGGRTDGKYLPKKKLLVALSKDKTPPDEVYL